MFVYIQSFYTFKTILSWIIYPTRKTFELTLYFFKKDL